MSLIYPLTLDTGGGPNAPAPLTLYSPSISVGHAPLPPSVVTSSLSLTNGSSLAVATAESPQGGGAGGGAGHANGGVISNYDGAIDLQHNNNNNNHDEQSSGLTDMASILAQVREISGALELRQETRIM